MPNHANFVHLHVHSAYSLAEGALRTKEIVELCTADKMPAVAVTDTNNLFGALEFATAASAKGVQSILGCQLAIGEDRKQLVFLVQNDVGYKNLSKLVSDAYMLGEDTSEVFAEFDALQDCSEGLICLSGGTLNGFRDEKDLLKLKEIFGDRFYIELQRHGLREEEVHEEALIKIAYDHNIPLVAANDCYFKDATMHEAHDALLCIAGGRYITEDDRRRVTKEHGFKSPAEMIELFADIPEAIQNTLVIAQRCSYLLKHIDPILPPFTEEGGEAEYLELERQAKEGLKWRVENYAQGEDPQPYFDKMDYELGIIKEMGFPGYFLIVSDFIKWAKDHDIPVGPGRGSGAGSVVAWALKITDLDPLKLGLLFERFLNPERLSMPDFDIDFCQDRRGEVINYVQEKYGRDRVAQIITFGKLQARAVVRDVGRVLQMPYFAVDRISKMIPNNPAHPTTLQEALDADADFRLEVDKDETSRKLIDIALKLEGLFRHASTHAAGLVIGDRPLHELVPLYRDPRSDMPVTQFNMKYVESAGLVKFDFLGLKTLTVVQMAVKFIKETTGKEYDMLALPLDDKASYDLMASGVSTGVFQLESTGMKDILRKMKPSQFEEIIALVSLYRPGPMDNIPTYISNKNGDTEPDYMHPKLKPILETTYGILIYQEQVLQAAQILAGYTLGGADFLRKAMGKKIKEEMDKQREQFVSGSAEHNDVPAEQASAIFDQIAKFAGYGFNRAHASCYALIAYQTAWLKANYPHEFMAASMTLDAGNTDKLSIFKQELDRMKIPLLQPDINKSDVMFRVEEFEGKKSVRYALAALKGVGEAAMEKIVSERNENGNYKDITDFINRLDPKAMNKRQFEGLVSAGAFECLHKNRAEVHGNIEMLLKTAQANAAERASGQESLFGGGGEGGVADLPPLTTIEPWDNLETLRFEFDAVGFYLSAHPLDSREDQLKTLGMTSVIDVPRALSRKPSNRLSMAGILIRKQERVSAKSGNKFAFLQLSDSTGVYEVMIFSDTLARCREILVPGSALMVDVDAEMRDEEIRYSGQRIQPLDEALAGKLRNLTIHIDATEPVQKIHDAVKGGGQGLVQVTLHAHLPNGEVAEIDLKGKHNIPPELLSDLQKTAGFLKMQES